jgi:glycine/D-amino acid oxidase-like deaminating enzyme
MADQKHVLVIGGGIIGAAITRALVNSGCAVSLFADPDHRPATFGSFAWINAHAPEQAHYFAMRLQAMQKWQDLLREHPHLPVSIPGSLDWDLDDISGTFQAYQAFDTRSELLSRDEIALRFPSLGDLPDQAIFNPLEGAADPNEIARALLAGLNHIETFQSKVLHLRARHGAVTGVETAEGFIDADHVIVAAGTETGPLLGSLDWHLPMKNDPGILVRTNPVQELALPILSTPGLHCRQMADGSILAGEDLGGGDADQDMSDLFQRSEQKLGELFPSAGQMRIQHHEIAVRPMTVDGFPAFGRVPGYSNLSMAFMHSGVTLAPLIGEALAAEIMTGTQNPDYLAYSPARFTQ